MWTPVYSQLSMNFPGLFGPGAGAYMTHSKGDKAAGTRH